VKTNSPQPRRVTNGVDSSRVAMLLAVLERRVGIALADKDVYVSTVGGVRITEPAADLAIAIAIASAVKDKPVKRKIAAFGEVSLAGEIRAVHSSKQRGSEAARLGHPELLHSDCQSVKQAIDLAL
jgi:DNA repair protein RadA/Sms